MNLEHWALFERQMCLDFENKPSGSIKIRVETIDYFLKRYREGLVSESELRRAQIRAFSGYPGSANVTKACG